MKEAKDYGFGSSADLPKGVDKADRASERKESMRGGVAIGKADKYGPDHQFNTGKTSGVCYTHTRNEYSPK